MRMAMLAGLVCAAAMAACGGTTTSPLGSSAEHLAAAGTDPKGDPGKGDPGKGDPGKGDPGKGDPGPGDPGSDCKPIPIPAAICGDPDAVKQLFVDVCGGSGSLGSPSGDFCDPKASIDCCPPAPPPAVCSDLPIPAAICGDPNAVKDFAVKACDGQPGSIGSPTGDLCDPKATVECCPSTPAPPPVPPTK